jgi:hypothetical protein
MTTEVRCHDHVTHPTRKSWHYLRRQSAIDRSGYFACGLKATVLYSVISSHYIPEVYTNFLYPVIFCATQKTLKSVSRRWGETRAMKM